MSPAEKERAKDLATQTSELQKQVTLKERLEKRAGAEADLNVEKAKAGGRQRQIDQAETTRLRLQKTQEAKDRGEDEATARKIGNDFGAADAQQRLKARGQFGGPASIADPSQNLTGASDLNPGNSITGSLSDFFHPRPGDDRNAFADFFHPRSPIATAPAADLFAPPAGTGGGVDAPETGKAANQLQSAAAQLKASASQLEGAGTNLDSAGTELAGAAGTLDGAATSLQNAASALETTFSNVQSAAADLEARVSNLESNTGS